MDRTRRWFVASLTLVALALVSSAHADCDAVACTDCRDDCSAASTTCGNGCWSSFMAAPALGGPVSLHLRYGAEGIDRVATLASCTATATTLRCTSS